MVSTGDEALGAAGVRNGEEVEDGKTNAEAEAEAAAMAARGATKASEALAKGALLALGVLDADAMYVLGESPGGGVAEAKAMGATIEPGTMIAASVVDRRRLVRAARSTTVPRPVLAWLIRIANVEFFAH